MSILLKTFTALSIMVLILPSAAIAQNAAQASEIFLQETPFTPISMTDALIAASKNNPQIVAARQQYQITQTDVDLARTAKRPNISASASYGYLDQDSNSQLSGDTSIEGETNAISLNLSQPLFRGFRTRNAIKGAEALSIASRQQVDSIEQSILLDVIDAYMNVHRDLVIADLVRENSDVLRSQLTANEKRFSLGDATATDVARSRSAVASAYTRIADNQVSLQRSRSTFYRLTGLNAQTLMPLPPTPQLPTTIEEFLAQARSKNPDVLTAQSSLDAAQYSVREAKGARLPSVDLTSSLSRDESPRNFGLFSDLRTTNAATIGISVNVPIYQAGQEFYNIRRARQVQRLREIELSQSFATVSDTVRSLWHQFQVSKVALDAHNDAVQAARAATDGTRAMYKSGLISSIDLIDTEQALLNARINRVRALKDHNAVIYSILRTTKQINVLH